MNILFLTVAMTGIAHGIEPVQITPQYVQSPHYQEKVKAGFRLVQTTPYKKEWMTESEMDLLGFFQHALGKCGGYADITDFPLKAAVPYRAFDVLGERELKHQTEIEPLLTEIKTSNLRKLIADLSSFHNRYYTSKNGADAALWIKNKMIEISKARTDVTVETFTHSFRQPSVIATLKGSGPLADEIVIIGGHEDSINWSSSTGGPMDSKLAPGADDNASGASTVIEVFRVLVESGFKPNRTLQFMTYAGEERGLLGSQDIAENYRAHHKKVVAVMQLDMTMYAGTSPAITLITDRVDPALNQFTKQLIDTYVKMPWAETECGYACSDHASWTDAGYASVFPFEAKEGSYNPYIHTVNDTLSAISPAFGTHFAKLGLAFLIELQTE